MPLPRCPYCRETFVPSHYHPDQAVCSALDCQRLRRAAYHRAKVQNDPSYRAQCRDSQKQWREQHPEYMRAYRQSRSARRPEVCPDQKQSDIVSLLERAKNNVAFNLSACAATILFVGRKQRVKNISASVQIILIEELPVTASSTSAL
jgi:ferric-dicitrate binding protein FerR (iron transport regulator)